MHMVINFDLHLSQSFAISLPRLLASKILVSFLASFALDVSTRDQKALFDVPFILNVAQHSLQYISVAFIPLLYCLSFVFSLYMIYFLTQLICVPSIVIRLPNLPNLNFSSINFDFQRSGIVHLFLVLLVDK
ncbi:hypothetical protein BpHYR1_026994 [Brachionus plicatilis]|uniref:Uncharacterized protein n=1 Tax=Brachionus plicatilis TaxID=10195 RepID=A0A3M7SPV8_BRAPC|nr:hypothetical protein BpHYR1_026994 [Brachionus plicatilis]